MHRIFKSLAFTLVGSFIWLSLGSESRADQLPEWTLLVFLNADNNLHSAGLDDLTEMEAIGSTSEVNIVVQFDGKYVGDSRRYFIEKGRRVEKYAFPNQAPSGEVDMGSAQSLVDFVEWGIQAYPAKRYFVTVWDHGSGWLKDRRSGLVRLRDGAELQGISYDDDSENHMSTPQLGQALASIAETLGRPIDIYGADACLMGMLEVAYELAPYADVVIGAESTEPADGWPYDDFLSELVADPTMNSDQLAEILVTSYGRSYSGGSQGRADTTLSAIRADLLPTFMDYSEGMFARLLDVVKTDPEVVRLAAKQSTRFDYRDNADLPDFLARVSLGLNKRAFQDVYAGWRDFYQNYLLIESVEVGSKFNGATGLAIWLPRWSSTLEREKDDYAELLFTQDTSWLEFLERMHGK